MKLSQFKQHLDHVSELNFALPNGNLVPAHFHITETGLTTKHFIDCGGTVRTKKTISLQIWAAEDYEHRLEPQKLKKIIALSEPVFGNEDLDVEIEYQTEIADPLGSLENNAPRWQTISRFGLDFSGHDFLLTTKQTNCLAKDHCGIPQPQTKLTSSALPVIQTSCCITQSGCS